MGARQIKELLLGCKALANEYSKQNCTILRQVQQQIQYYPHPQTYSPKLVLYLKVSSLKLLYAFSLVSVTCATHAIFNWLHTHGST
jgi:hypothetical protein